jgi:hypothetical protein
MNTKEMPRVSTSGAEFPPHRAMSRAPSDHNVTTILLGCVAAAGVLAILWALYAFA